MIATSGPEIATSGPEIATSGREIATSGREIATSGRDITISACGVGARLVSSRLQVVISTAARETTPCFHHATMMSRVSRQDRGRHET